MPDSYRVIITARALAELEDISEYIAQDSAQNAATMIRTLLDAMEGLDILPHRFDVPRGATSRRRNVRLMPVPPYLVRYRIEEKKHLVYIVRIRHGARRS